MHRGEYDRLYRIWKAMRCRCRNPHFKEYYRYGGRGISICEEWDDYAVFQNWAYANGYKDNLTIDRINNDGDYCSENCRWITLKEQQKTRSTCRMIEYKGRTQNMTAWANEFGIKVHTLKCRLNRGWSVERALEEVVA